MSIAEKMAALAKRVPELRDKLETEEATKNALVMPFLTALGYDVFDPSEVLPEFTADVGIKKGEKVDYAIMRDDHPVILIECKRVSVDPRTAQHSQLYRYFSVTKARVGIVTNGIKYHFYSDIDEPNKLDEKPFLELDLLDLREPALTELSKLAKANFDEVSFVDAAAELKYLSEIKAILVKQYDAPEEDFGRWFFGRINPGKHFRGSQKDQFMGLLKTALHQFVREKLRQKFDSALGEDTSAPAAAAPPAQEAGTVPAAASEREDAEADDNGVVTTDEELEGYFIVKSIIREVVAAERVAMRDTKSYFGVLLDDNNRKPICRLHFNRKQKYLGLFDSEKNEERIAIETLDDVFKHRQRLTATAKAYLTEDASDS